MPSKKKPKKKGGPKAAAHAPTKVVAETSAAMVKDVDETEVDGNIEDVVVTEVDGNKEQKDSEGWVSICCCCLFIIGHYNF